MQDSDQRPKQKTKSEISTARPNFGRFILTFPGPLATERDLSPMRDVDLGEAENIGGLRP
jgi:hypothetical protein